LAELGDASRELERVTALLAARGLSAFVADKSRPDVALHVAHVLVPGLRHVWPRFASGRLYDVPVMLGLRERAALEHEHNPDPLLL
jgi:ribosomal protein S12 methylthiotransferase accessory factor